jgi:hypothetical protein
MVRLLYSNPTSESSSDENLVTRMFVVYDEKTDTLYTVEFDSSVFDTLTNKTVLQTDKIQAIIDSAKITE